MKAFVLLAALLPLALAVNTRNGGVPSSASIVIVNSFNDASPPEITDASCTSTLIDISGGSASYSCSIVAVDLYAPASGVSNVVLQFQSPSTKQKTTGNSCGSAGNGRYQCTGTFPRYSETGIWYLEYANVTDNAFNRRTYRHGDQFFLHQSYTVVGRSDSYAPRITYFSMTPTSANANTTGGTNPSWYHNTITIETNCTDVTTVGERTECYYTTIYFTPPAGVSLPGGRYEVGLTVYSTTQLEPGIYRQIDTFSADTGFLGRGYASGDWKVSRIRTWDYIGNWREYGAYELQTDATFANKQTLTINQGTYADRTPPVVTSYALFPDRLDLVDRSGVDRVCANVTLQGDLTVTGGGPFRVQARTWVMIEGPTPFTMGPCTGTSPSSSGSSNSGCYYEIQQPGPFTLMRFCDTPPSNFHVRPGVYFVSGVVADDGMLLYPDLQAAPYPLQYSNQALYGFCSRYDGYTNGDSSRPGICYDDNKSSAFSLAASLGLTAVLALIALLH